jgi:hypothetical protein
MPLDEGDDFHLRATLGTANGVRRVHLLDQRRLPVRAARRQAQPLRASRAEGERAGIPVPAAAGCRWARWPRVLFEYLPAALRLAQAGTRTRRGASGSDDNRRRRPEAGFRPARPWRARPWLGCRLWAGGGSNRTSRGTRAISYALQPAVSSLQPVDTLRTLGGAGGSRPALGEELGHGLRLRAKGTGGAVASRARRRICSPVNCTPGGRRDRRFQPL